MNLKAAGIITMVVIFSTANAETAVSDPPFPDMNLLTCTSIMLAKQLPCPDFHIFFQQGSAVVQRAFNEKNFDRLDKLYTQWSTGNDRFPDGRWKLSQYGDGLSENFSTWKNWGKDLETIKSWQNLRPKSEAAQYAEAVYWRTYAWKARGGGYASSVSKEGWELFRERLNKSKEILDRLKAAPSLSPAPYPIMLGVLTDLGASEDQLVKVYSEGTSRFPEYHNIYFSMARHYQPRWGGSVKKYDAFAKLVTEQTKKFEGMGMYARLYWLVDYENEMPFFEGSSQPPEWKKLHAGYEDLMQKYPSSMHNIGKYAGVACRTKDSKLYRELRSKIVGHEQSADMFDPVDVCDRRHQWTSTMKQINGIDQSGSPH